ncbi:MAG: zinc ribbon domain-containing protein [Thermodesulfovibrionales bacterium]
MYRLFLLSLVAGVIGAIVADRKGRSWVAWGLLCWAFPLLLVVLVFLRPALSPGATKRCPHCGEVIRHEATVCRYCKRELPIEMVECPRCGKFVPAGERCPECGQRHG